MNRVNRAGLALGALLLVGTLMAGISWIAGHASAQPARVLTGGTWCC